MSDGGVRKKSTLKVVESIPSLVGTQVVVWYFLVCTTRTSGKDANLACLSVQSVQTNEYDRERNKLDSDHCFLARWAGILQGLGSQ
jgi:hypothetical protein